MHGHSRGDPSFRVLQELRIGAISTEIRSDALWHKRVGVAPIALDVAATGFLDTEIVSNPDRIHSSNAALVRVVALSTNSCRATDVATACITRDPKRECLENETVSTPDPKVMPWLADQATGDPA